MDSKEDRLFFENMFKEWYAQFFYFAYHFLNDVEASRDVVNDAFEYWWRNFNKVEKSTAKTYLYSIVRARCIDILRRQHVHEDYLEFVEKASRQQRGLSISEEDERIVGIRKAMNKLTPYTRHILEQCYVLNKKYREVAEELNVSVAAIHKHIVKALHILRKELGQKG